MKIAVVGTRGFPDVQGGVEAHCEYLYPYLAEKGCDITVFTRKPYVASGTNTYKGVSLVPIACPQSKYFETFVHTLKGVIHARKLSPDILHIHAIGPSLFTPLARLLGMPVVVTHHGENYRHMKWGFWAKLFLRFCEAMGMLFANRIIAISEPIALSIRKKYHRSLYVIPNGVQILERSDDVRELVKFGLESHKYILAVGRLVPEKGLHVLIDAFSKLNIEDWKLVIVGNADHADRYSRTLKGKAEENKQIVLTGFLNRQSLQKFYSHAGLFVIPSFYEGMPISLLEAMSFGLACIASDIPANKNIGLSEDNFFKAGDSSALAAKMKQFISRPSQGEDAKKQINLVAERYNWGKIAENTMRVYDSVINPQLKIVVLGTRGFPNVQGGVERHCEELYPRLAKLGCDVTVITRAPYIQAGNRVSAWNGVKFVHRWCPKIKSFEAIIHTLIGVIDARRLSPDLLHIHAVGPSLLTPVAKLLGMRVIVTNHGPDYERAKWGKIAKKVLRLGERCGVKYSRTIITISKGIRAHIKQIYKKDAVLIPNGVNIPLNLPPGQELEKWGLKPGEYIFTACRFVPEKGLHDLLNAYSTIKNPTFKLVIAGDADHETDYSRDIKKIASEINGVVLTGFVSGRRLGELFSNAGLFVLPSYYEGLPIALLEALSYKLPVLVSDIPQHRELPLTESRYFQLGNIEDFADALIRNISLGISIHEQEANLALLKEDYNWDTIATKTLSAYRKAIEAGR